MKTTISFLFIYVVVSSISIVNAINIDSLIAQQQKHIHRKETKIDQLTQAFNSASDLKEQHKVCSKIIDEYLHFNADSALVYGIKGAQISSKLDSSVHQQFFLPLSQAFIHSGFIHKAEDFLQFYRSLNDSTIDFAA